MPETTKEYIDMLSPPDISLDMPVLVKMLVSHLRENPEEARKVLDILVEASDFDLEYSSDTDYYGTTHKITLTLGASSTYSTSYKPD